MSAWSSGTSFSKLVWQSPLGLQIRCTYLDGFLLLQLDIPTIYPFLHVFHDDGPTPTIDEDAVRKVSVVADRLKQ